jgi:hypothetical protein
MRIPYHISPALCNKKNELFSFVHHFCQKPPSLLDQNGMKKTRACINLPHPEG